MSPKSRKSAVKAKKTAAKTKKKSTTKKNPVGIMDTTLRDGHQSTLATRMRIEDMLPVLADLDKAGFAALEVWGGATFDVCARFLNEDPWDRLATIKKIAPNTPLQMLLRGQNVVGYRHYADDVVEEFCIAAAETGMDIFRVFDALNDERNYISSYRALKKTKAHIQGTICYSLTQRHLGGEIYNIEYFLKKAKTLEDMGADSICVKDMAGIMAPMDAYDLISALKDNTTVPIQLHTHYTSGMGSMTYLKAVEAGVDIIDCALAPFALRTSQPAVEPIVVALEGTARETGLDISLLTDLGRRVEEITPKYRDFLNATKMSVIDTNVLVHQIPGGMLSNLVNQLKEADALDRINEVYEDLPKTRAEMGYPPLVTPSSQIVGIQSVQNVLFGRYKMVSGQIKEYAYGMYGKPPVPMDKKVQKMVLKGYERGEKPTTKRPGDLLKPELPEAKEAVKHMTSDIKDVLTYAMQPVTGMKFLRWKYGLETTPEDVKGKTMAQVKAENELVEKALKGLLIEKPAKEIPEKGPAARNFNVFVDGDYYQVEVDEPGGTPRVSAPQAAQRPAAAPAAAAPAPAAKPKAPPASGNAVASPMPGIIIDYKVKPGDKVEADQVLLIVEAMKMQNEIKATQDGTVEQIMFKDGDKVDKGDTLLTLS